MYLFLASISITRSLEIIVLFLNGSEIPVFVVRNCFFLNNYYDDVQVQLDFIVISPLDLKDLFLTFVYKKKVAFQFLLLTGVLIELFRLCP
ncbi:hypothetical protein VNO77_17606 [Canavalia gladiata]|uniref:Uncharacterized protein n=1 Tax=Canavalia gladiata TaxID=3824 RepID=A0AAN9LMX0_CANGL